MFKAIHEEKELRVRGRDIEIYKTGTETEKSE